MIELGTCMDGMGGYALDFATTLLPSRPRLALTAFSRIKRQAHMALHYLALRLT